MSAVKEIQALKQELAEIKQRLKRLEFFAGDVSRDAWSRAKRDANETPVDVTVGKGLPAPVIRTETNGIGL